MTTDALETTLGSLLAAGLAAVAVSFLRPNDRSDCESAAADDDSSKGSSSSSSSSSTSTKNDERPAIPRVCGEWCSKVMDKKTPCLMDQRLIQCRGEYCQTTAGLWSLFMLGPLTKPRPVPCDMYKAGIAYPIGGGKCDESCLIPEIQKERYPLPTGWGVFCRPGTCFPGATPRPACGKGLGTLQCPCNWFGSECETDWQPIRRIRKRRIGYLDHVTFELDPTAWQAVVADYRPGGVVRLNMKERAPSPDNDRSSRSHDDDDGNDDYAIYELACAVAKCSTPGEIEVLVAPPIPTLRWEVTHVGEYIRSLAPTTTMVDKQLYINPIISGFYNAHYEYLLGFLASKKVASSSQEETKMDQLVILSTGAGLSGALSAIEAVLEAPQNNTAKATTSKSQNNHHRPLKIHWYHGLRNIHHLPYCERINELVETGKIQLTLVVSNSDRDDYETYATDDGANSLPVGIRNAATRGEQTKANVIMASNKGSSTPQKVYVQHVLEHDLASGLGAASSSDDETTNVVANSALLRKTAFVICGRMQVIDDSREILGRLCSNNNGSKHPDSGLCKQLLEERVFLNI